MNDDMVKHRNFTARLGVRIYDRGIHGGALVEARPQDGTMAMAGSVNHVRSNSPNDGNFNDGPIRIK